MPRRPLLRLLAATLLGPACAALPPGGPERGLWADLDRIVESEERDEWIADRREVADLESTALRSACQVSPARRERLLAWLDARIRAEGGPARDAYRRAGRDLDAVEDLLHLERVRALLAHAHDLGPQDCPFWLEPDPSFAGVQGDAHRFVVLLESVGSVQLVLRGGERALGGAGGGRILPAWGFGHRVTLATGVELGGAGAFPRDESGARTLEAVFTVAAPLLLRVHDGTTIFDTEVAAIAQFTEADVLALRPGVRVAQAVGLTTLRLGDLMPYGALWIAWETSPAFEGEPMAHALRIGTRFGLDWDP